MHRFHACNKGNSNECLFTKKKIKNLTKIAGNFTNTILYDDNLRVTHIHLDIIVTTTTYFIQLEPNFQRFHYEREFQKVPLMSDVEIESSMFGLTDVLGKRMAYLGSYYISKFQKYLPYFNRKYHPSLW